MYLPILDISTETVNTASDNSIEDSKNEAAAKPTHDTCQKRAMVPEFHSP